MNYSFGDNKKRQSGSASSLTEARRRAVVAQTWNFNSKQPKIPSASFITTVEAMNASTLAFENARNAGVVPRINLSVDVPSSLLTATKVVSDFAPVRIINTVAIADTPLFSITPDLPFGLSFSTSDGTVSGTPMETITATTFTVTVSAASIYPTPVSSSASFVLTVRDSTSGLTYQGYTGTILSTSLPSIDNPPSSWGTARDDSFLTNILSSAANVIFDTEAVAPREQQVAVYFSGYFKAPETGDYAFTEVSDDGLEWNFDGGRIVDIPGSQRSGSATTGLLSLVANRYYPMNGLWSQGGGPGNLYFTSMTIGGVNKISTYPIKNFFYH